jgi:hypothetical protein
VEIAGYEATFVPVFVRLPLGDECRKQVDERLISKPGDVFPVAGIIVMEKIEIVIAKIEVAAILSSEQSCL